MARKNETDALIGIGKLEALASGYEKTAKTLRKLARGLRKVVEGVGVHPAAPSASKSHQTPGKGTRRRSRKPMSPAARKALSEKMKAKWAERKAGKAPSRRAGDKNGGVRGEAAA